MVTAELASDLDPMLEERPTVLFVTYGGGHASMILPVAKSVMASKRARVTILGLTTAAEMVRDAGLPLLRFLDFVDSRDKQAMVWGSRLAQQLHSNMVDLEESQAYLGLSFADLVATHGIERAEMLYEEHGRHIFLPIATLSRVLHLIRPDAVVITNSPRAERAAGIAARKAGIPALCINSLFAIDEINWIGQRGFCDRICVLNEAVRQKLIYAGRSSDEVVVTGNPSFDCLHTSGARAAGQQLRDTFPKGTTHVVLWASQPELASHPTAPGLVGDPELPTKILNELLKWVEGDDGRFLLVRPHPNEEIPNLSRVRATVFPAKEYGIAELLNACDTVVTMTSTVAVQAHTLGLHILQVRGSIYDHSMPLKEMGIANECRVSTIAEALDQIYAHNYSRRTPQTPLRATEGVANEILGLLSQSQDSRSSLRSLSDL